MQIGFFELPAGWQELETATGETFASDSTYQIQVRDKVIMVEAAALPENSNYDGLIVEDGEIVKYSPGAQKLYVRPYKTTGVNITQLEA